MDDDFSDIEEDAPVEKKEHDYDHRFQDTDDYKTIQQTLKKLRNLRDKVGKSREKFEFDRRKVTETQDPIWLQKIEHHYAKLSRLGYPRHEIPEVPHINLAKYAALPAKNPDLNEPLEIKSTKGKTWSPEELVKLERLLKEYPDEPVQGHRWEKIARALGNRNPRQVASRVLKIFAKMARAGVPVPGKFNTDSVQKKAKKRRGFKPHPSTVSIHTSHIQYYRAPVVALPEDSDSDGDGIVDPEKMDVDDELKQFAHLKDTEEFRELMRLKKIQRRKQSRAREVYISEDHSHDIVHFGFQCVSCGVEPIVGTRFHCMQCAVENAVDLCSKCHQEGSYTSDYHPRNHRFQRIDQVEDDFFVDQDYATPGASRDQYRRRAGASSSSRVADSDMAYLDDGFMPV